MTYNTFGGTLNLTQPSYADETQLYTRYAAADGSMFSAKRLHCIDDTDRWMSSNRVN